jgi:hypothetical protein
MEATVGEYLFQVSYTTQGAKGFALALLPPDGRG